MEIKTTEQICNVVKYNYTEKEYEQINKKWIAVDDVVKRLYANCGYKLEVDKVLHRIINALTKNSSEANASSSANAESLIGIKRDANASPNLSNWRIKK